MPKFVFDNCQQMVTFCRPRKWLFVGWIMRSFRWSPQFQSALYQ